MADLCYFGCISVSCVVRDNELSLMFREKLILKDASLIIRFVSNRYRNRALFSI